ncbi:hypothetical protein PG993_009042 [Apiospora rasikravindrae]|uniref:Uncharacterized protein n=1 Tax=Apiospora rasikravindrae TaxID=990691 RepID=A0ABR1SIA7_9PEZI
MVSEEVIVALALGVPSLLVAAISLWITYLTYSQSRLMSCPPARRIPSWPAAHYSFLFDTGSDSASGDAYSPVVPRATFPGDSLRRRTYMFETPAPTDWWR